MAGGKETPRQKMIGMMYLVLTALLALNVSKEIIRAFVTINDKLDASSFIVTKTSGANYDLFQQKLLALQQEKSDTKKLEFWKSNSDKLKIKTNQTVHFLLSESNEMIKEAEGVEWIAKKDEKTGLITELKPLMEISAMDNYDIPTNRFIGGNPMSPKKEGLALRDSIHAYRNYVSELMGTYTEGKNNWVFKAPDDDSKVNEALKTANPKDTAKIRQFYQSLTLPAMIDVKDGGKLKSMPWPSVMFDHAPIVAAAAMITALKVDILNAESIAVEYMVNKVEAPVFNFNKITPLSFARTSYINQGDTLNLMVLTAAYDSNEVAIVRYGINEDDRSKWKQTEVSPDPSRNKSIRLEGNTPGEYLVTGTIEVKKQGEVVEEPFTSFRYTVGKPSGAVSLPEMNVLYRGYPNKVTGAASGFPDYKLVGGGNVTLNKGTGGIYVASPGAGQEATIIVQGIAEDGSTAKLGDFKFRVKNLPKPSIYFGGLEDGQDAPSATIKAQTRLFAKYGPEIPLLAEFTVKSWEVNVTGAPRPETGTGSGLTPAAIALIKQARPGNTVSFMCTVVGPDGKARKSGASFKVR